ncbi:MAG: hypothetical protein M3463_14740, partial [Verrucomicrobiota bacterium]|nr:hypothetical protein [Verrucomicrobiota bacterium]
MRVPRLFHLVMRFAFVVPVAAVADPGAPDPVKKEHAVAAKLPPAAARPIDFERDIQPLFEASCTKCHAKGKDKGGFSIETRAAFLKGGDTGPAAVPGKSAESLVVELVAASDQDEVMPKKGTHWTPQQVGLLRAWIDQGLPWP